MTVEGLLVGSIRVGFGSDCLFATVGASLEIVDVDGAVVFVVVWEGAGVGGDGRGFALAEGTMGVGALRLGGMGMGTAVEASLFVSPVGADTAGSFVLVGPSCCSGSFGAIAWASAGFEIALSGPSDVEGTAGVFETAGCGV